MDTIAGRRIRKARIPRRLREDEILDSLEGNPKFERAYWAWWLRRRFRGLPWTQIARAVGFPESLGKDKLSVYGRREVEKIMKQGVRHPDQIHRDWERFVEAVREVRNPHHLRVSGRELAIKM